MRTAKPKISVTKNYRMFHNHIDNRDLCQKKHRRLKSSMAKHGFLASFPIVCSRNGDQHLKVDDGQHRLAFAEELGLPVYYTVSDTAFDIAEINSAAVQWNLRDYANKWAKQGKKDYQEVIDFSEDHGIPIGMAFSILGGEQPSAGNKGNQIRTGTFKVREREFANEVAKTYAGLVDMSSSMRNSRCLGACSAVCRVPEFDSKRLLHGASKCRDKLVSYSSRDSYLELFEELYNYNRVKLVPLKMPAIQVMRERCPVKRKAKK